MKRKQYTLIFLILIISALFITGCVTQNNRDSSSGVQGGQGKTIISSQSPDSNNLISIITIKNYAFIPTDLKIKSGTTVRWINQDSTTHTIKSDNINSPSIGSGQAFEYKFETVGTYDYICGIHPSMKGRIIVE